MLLRSSSKNSLPNPKSCRLSLYFLLLVLYLTFKSMLYFEVFLYLFNQSAVCSSVHFIVHGLPLSPLSKLSCLCLCGCTSGLSSVTMCLSCQYHIVFNYWSFTTALKSFNMNLPILFFSELFCLSIQILESACQYIPKILRFLFGLI